LSVRRLLLVVATAALVAVPAAQADGDPASDYLLSQPLFNPPDSGVPAAYASQLTSVLESAKRDGYEIRVALIPTRYDLGSVGVLDKKPKQYARFLGQELSFVYMGRLLVVMPNGLGYAKGGKADAAKQAVVDRIAPPRGSPVAMATAATQAVVGLAAREGVHVTVPPLHGDTSVDSQNRDRLLIVLAVVVALAAFGLYSLVRRRAR
jgi:hypothetical protein